MKKVITVCPYCGTGCKINLLVENDKVVGAEGANGRTNEGQLCLKGYYGWDFLNDTNLLTPRLKSPMIRRERGGKLESVSWDEAIEFASSRLSAIKAKYGADAIRIEAQTYARKLYEDHGFRQDGEEFLEDDIPHIPMIWHAPKD